MVCSKCNLDLGYETIEACHLLVVHSVIKEPTCTKNGIVKYECQNCDYISYKETPATHQWTNVIIQVQPSDKNKGSVTQECESCGKTEIILVNKKE